MSADLLRVEGLDIALDTRKGSLRATRQVSFGVERGKTLAIVGESGCGKSITALAIMRLLPSPPARIAAGSIKLNGRDLVTVSEKEMMSVRGRDISMIFQDPMTSLNPVLTIGRQLVEVLQAHIKTSSRQTWSRAIELLELVGIPSAAVRINDYPHQLSGGMNQRVMIAMAIACNPKVLVADEPTTALDVTIQAQILDLLRALQRDNGMGLIMITHDLGVVAEMADRVAVMYAGQIVEEGTVDTVLDHPMHPYTRGLLGASPSGLSDRKGRLAEIPGMVPPLADLPPGCAFSARCGQATQACREIAPVLSPVANSHAVACLMVQPVKLTMVS
jgi:peptide/nickel transport system ATP-binding protein